MIRLLYYKLIIPRGDSGEFSILTPNFAKQNDVIYFNIYDEHMKHLVFQKEIPFSSPVLKIQLTHSETINLIPNTYKWDITFYTNPQYDDNNTIIDAEEVNSLFAPYRVPICKIVTTALGTPSSREETNYLMNYYSKLVGRDPFAYSQIKNSLYSYNKTYGIYANYFKEYHQLLAGKTVHISSIDAFPSIGDNEHVYLDEDSGEIYLFIEVPATEEHLNNKYIIIKNSKEAQEAQKEVLRAYIPIWALASLN